MRNKRFSLDGDRADASRVDSYGDTWAVVLAGGDGHRAECSHHGAERRCGPQAILFRLGRLEFAGRGAGPRRRHCTARAHLQRRRSRS